MPDRDTDQAGAAATMPAEPVDMPTGIYIELGAGSTVSFANESNGVNSGAHNKSVEELLSVFETQGDAILQAATSDIRDLFQSTPS